MDEQKHEELVQLYETKSQERVALIRRKWDLDDEMDAIKRQVEEDCTTQGSPNFVPTKTDLPKVVKRLLAQHMQYQQCIGEMHATETLLMQCEAEIEAARMRAWAIVALAQQRQLQPSEMHTHPTG